MIARRTALGVRVDGNGSHFTVDWAAASRLRLPDKVEFRAVPAESGRLTAWRAGGRVILFDGPTRTGEHGPVGDLIGSFCEDVFEVITGVRIADKVLARFDLEVTS